MFTNIEDSLELASLHFAYLTESQIENLAAQKPASYDIIIAFTKTENLFSERPFKFNSTTHQAYLTQLYHQLEFYQQVIKPNGTLYIYGLPQLLPYLATYLDSKAWKFKYWLALENKHFTANSMPIQNTHTGILLYVKNKDKFHLRKARSAHQKCDVCGEYTADWGGKSHLRHSMGYAISDVWDDLPQITDEKHILSKEIWQRLILLTAKEHSNILCANYEGDQDLERFIFE